MLIFKYYTGEKRFHFCILHINFLSYEKEILPENHRAFASSAFLLPGLLSAADHENQIEKWLNMREDPVYRLLPGEPEGSKKADFFLPAQLVAARAGRVLNRDVHPEKSPIKSLSML